MKFVVDGQPNTGVEIQDRCSAVSAWKEPGGRLKSQPLHRLRDIERRLHERFMAGEMNFDEILAYQQGKLVPRPTPSLRQAQKAETDG